MQTIDGQELVKGLQERARRTGRDLWEVMESEGFMLTRTRRLEVGAEALSVMLRFLDREQASQVLRAHLGGRIGTPNDMYDAIVKWVEEFREAWVAGNVG